MSDAHGITYGLKPESHNGYCNFMPGPGQPACLAVATWHAFIEVDPVQVASSCDAHRVDLQRVAEFIHVHGSACSIPGASIWWDPDADPNSGCEIDWDMGALVAVATEPTAAMVEAAR